MTYGSKPSQAIRFTNSFKAKAKAWGLSEKDALDVYHHGKPVKDNILVRKYSGYELGIWYFTDSRYPPAGYHRDLEAGAALI